MAASWSSGTRRAQWSRRGQPRDSRGGHSSLGLLGSVAPVGRGQDEPHVKEVAATAWFGGGVVQLDAGRRPDGRRRAPLGEKRSELRERELLEGDPQRLHPVVG